MSSILLLLSIGMLLAGGLVCLVLRRREVLVNRMGAVASVLAAAAALLAAGHVLVAGCGSSLALPWSVPFGAFHIAMDGLSAFFVLAISAICGLSAIYGVGYLKAYLGQEKLGVSWFFYTLLFASMLMVVVARNGVLFLLAWEVMALASFFLVMFEHERPEVREAGWTYMVAMHMGTAFLLAMFVLLGWRNGTMDFDRFAVPADGAMASVLFLLAVVGFGTKAGFLPMHIWLPEAHPAAPSHVSAVMSGVMIKTGIYGLVRIVMLLGPPPAWWGWTLLFIGAASGVGGVLFALAQHDLKRLMAYHSVENIGIICLGLGFWLLGTSTGNDAIATLGLVGGLLHVWNHAIFKSLLFLGTGSIVHATGTRDIEQLGGLLKRMRYTGPAFLIGAAAICGLPPFNGFVSEMLIYVAALKSVANTGVSHAAIAGLVVIASLAMIGGLAAACFAKVFGIAFLGSPRSDAARQARETEKSMWAPIGVLAALCLLIGLLGPWAAAAAGALLIAPGAEVAAVADAQGLLLRVSGAGGVLIAVTLALWGLRRCLQSGRSVERRGTWDCGYAAPSERMQYTASSFASPILNLFGWFLRPRLHRRLPAGLFPRRVSLASHTDDVFRRYAYNPLFSGVAWLAFRLRWLQQGRNQLYVLYIALTLLILLLGSLV